MGVCGGGGGEGGAEGIESEFRNLLKVCILSVSILLLYYFSLVFIASILYLFHFFILFYSFVLSLF